MTKRLVLLAGVVLIALSAAPDAMATHCERCRFYPIEGEWACITPPPLLGGHEFCAEGGTWCEEWGTYCPPHSKPPLASEYTVESVERLDEPVEQTEIAQVSER